MNSTNRHGQRVGKSILAFAAAALALAAAPPALAGAKFSGNTGYQFVDGGAISLTADYIQNTSKENATGTLMVKLWALDAPYQGASVNGVLLGSYKLDGLGPGQYYTAPKKIVTGTAPLVRKSYHICMMLSEFQGGKYVTVDYRNMAKPVMLGPTKLFALTGPFRWQTSIEGGTVEIEVAKIAHFRQGTTGGLKLSVWATDEPYKGGHLRGYEIGSVIKKPLEKGYSYTNVKNVAKYNPPPAGTYYVCIVLSEFGSDKKYSVVDYITGTKPSKFGPPVKP